MTKEEIIEILMRHADSMMGSTEVSIPESAVEELADENILEIAD